MTTENYYKGIENIMQITPESVQSCEACNERPNDFADAVNHYLNMHGYKLLHVGTQSSKTDHGEVVHDVIAVLGK
ncbi:MAG: hypothetical protein IEMM0007_0234 [bacterium]|nr:MAG: hypothetical protein IEMM0007_0234 [bacterium]